MRQVALQYRPWRFATGPKTAQGKAQVALNGKSRQKGSRSVREIQGELAELWGLLRDMREVRRLVETPKVGTG